MSCNTRTDPDGRLVHGGPWRTAAVRWRVADTDLLADGDERRPAVVGRSEVVSVDENRRWRWSNGGARPVPRRKSPKPRLSPGEMTGLDGIVVVDCRRLMERPK